MHIDYYSILEIPPDTTQAQIKQQYRLLLHAWHPDKFPNQDQKLRAQERTKALNEAYSILGDPDKRANYDATRSSKQSKQSHSNPNQRQGAPRTEQQQQKEKRAQYEREREAEAEARWRQRFEAEGSGKAKERVTAKPSFLQHWFNKARCVVGAHKGQWIYDRSDRCTQIRRCELCQELSTRTDHDWTEWRYQSDDNCDRVRSCKRCGEKDYSTQADHDWTEWRYQSDDNCDCVRSCKRCGEKDYSTQADHDWTEWRYQSDDNCDRVRSCKRCGQTGYKIKHNWDQWVYVGTTNCVQMQICGRCQAKSEYTRIVHDWSEGSYDEFDTRRSRVCRRCREKMSEFLSPTEPQVLSTPSLVSKPKSLSGIWLAGDGLPVQFQQVGRQVTFRGVNALGAVVVGGRGIIEGNQAHLMFEYYDRVTYDRGETVMEISPDGWHGPL